MVSAILQRFFPKPVQSQNQSQKPKQAVPEKAAAPANRSPQSFIKAAEDFERSKIEEIKFSRKVAWIIAGVATTICTVSIMAFLVALLNRTEPEPVVLKVDNETGATTILRSMRDAQDKYGEVVDKYWLATYVRNREGYDWYTISESFEATKLMSMDNVFSEYAKKVQAANSALVVLKEHGKVGIKITSIAFTGNLAQVRFTSEKLSSSGENQDSSPVQKWLATISYQFKPTGRMTEQERLVNPLGFNVISYRVDPEVLK